MYNIFQCGCCIYLCVGVYVHVVVFLCELVYVCFIFGIFLTAFFILPKKKKERRNWFENFVHFTRVNTIAKIIFVPAIFSLIIKNIELRFLRIVFWFNSTCLQNVKLQT